uniref:C2 domain-containing protein n=1 Tax=Zooxanthella nutricula TaxID=1333877 RepID=A0A7S2LBM6_9DINO
MGNMGGSFTFEADHFTLGQKPAKFDTLRIIDTIQEVGDATNLRVMTVRTKVTWTSNMTAYANFTGLQKVGVSGLCIQGDMVLELVGEAPRPPFFQAARGRFLNAPDLSFDVKAENSALDAVTSLDSVKDTLRQVVTEQVCAKLVIPNRMAFKLIPDADTFRMLHPRPRGVLRLKLVRAEGLLAKDLNLFSNASSDPFVKITCGAIKFETPVIYNTCSPQFDFATFLPIELPMDQFVLFEVFDKDVITRNDHLGKAKIGVKDLIAQGGKERKYQLCDANDNVGSNGLIVVEADWRKLQIGRVPERKNSGGDPDLCYLFVGIASATGLLCAHPETHYWVEVQCTHRQGLLATDTSKPRCTQKLQLKPVQSTLANLTAEKQAEAEAALQEKLDLCHRYGMKDADVSKLLGVTVCKESKEDKTSHAEVMASTVMWNRPLEFFLKGGHDATITLALECDHAHAEKRTGHHGGMAAVKGMMSKLAHGTWSDRDGCAVLCEWSEKVSDLIGSGGTTDKVLKATAKQGNTVELTVHMQLRACCEPGTVV